MSEPKKIPAPTGYLQCFFGKRIIIHKKFYLLFMSVCLLTAFIGFFAIWAALPFSVREKYGNCRINCHNVWNNSTAKFHKQCDYRLVCKYAWAIPFCVMMTGLVCYLFIVDIVIIQKSHCFKNIELGKNFLLGNMCIPYGFGNFFLSDEEFQKDGECSCLPILPGIYLGANCCPCDQHEEYFVERTGHQSVSCTSWLFIPFSVCMMIMYFVVIVLAVIIIIPTGITIGIVWLLWLLLKSIYKQFTTFSCSWNYCNLCGFFEIDTVPTDYDEVDI